MATLLPNPTTTSHRWSESKDHETKKHGSDPPLSSSSRFSIFIKSLSGTNYRRWFYQSYQTLINSCSQVVNYARLMYRYLRAVKDDEREVRAQRNRVDTRYHAARRAAIRESLQQWREGAAIRTIITTPETASAIHQSAVRKREEMATRAGLYLDEVPYPVLWLEWLIRKAEGLPSLHGWGVGFWGMEWQDVVSMPSPFSWWARFWEWYWTDSFSWTRMMIFLSADALWVRFWLGLGFWPCLVVLAQTMVICYMCSVHVMLEAVFANIMN